MLRSGVEEGGPCEKIAIIPKDFQIFTYKWLNFLTFLTHTEIWENFSFKPPKIWQFISANSEKNHESLKFSLINGSIFSIFSHGPP